ncbi:MAG: hypothetical protein BGO41_08060 [Clostridiales bacterium 38-18]|nr:MAG: hypothetical protein BGO41_08060 [Clostridiales bacterium 38-18]
MNKSLINTIKGLLINDKKQIFFTLILASLTILFSVALMSLSSYVLSYAALLPSIAELALAITFVRFLGIGRGLLRYVERLETHNMIFIALSHLRIQLYEKYRTLKGETLITLNKIEAFQQLTLDINTYQDAILRGVLPSLLTLIIGILIALILLVIQPTMALIFAILYPLFAFSSFFVFKARNVTQATLHSLEIKQLQTDFSDYIQYRDLFKWQSIEPYKMAQIMKQVNEVEVSMTNLTRSQSYSKLFQQLGIHFHFLLMLLFTSYLVSQNHLDGLYLGSLTLVIFNLYESALLLGDAPDKMRNGAESAARLFSDVKAPMATSSGVISIAQESITYQDIKFTYPNTAFQLVVPMFKLNQGKHIAFVGANGSGKSTFGSLLSGFYEIDGKAATLRDVFSVVTQEIYLFNDSLIANLRVGNSDLSNEVIEQVLRMVSLDSEQWLKSQTPLGEDGKQISLGQKRRIGIARALLRPSVFLLLDEPFNGLDLTTARSLHHNLFKQKEKTIICITHHLIEMTQYDEIYVFDQGKIVASGTHDQLIATSTVYQHLYNETELSY